MVKKYFDINDSTNFFLQQIEEYKININLYLFQRYWKNMLTIFY